ncbi:ESPR-type extended signal peptide-containing protein, partial [Phascolarctobacterium succinatutens]|uniref:ESPR-type extended signal peptide-containing protein n=1 Tax=Phascolarctobacterium succinatutens TaxID=626940 RepID=UPI0023F8C045
MNKVFKVIWSEARNAYVVVSEMAKSHGTKSCSTKKLLTMLIATGVMTCASMAPAMAATNVDSNANVTVKKGATVTVAENATVTVGDNAIALGKGAYAVKNSIAIGNGAYTQDGTWTRGQSVALGNGAVTGAKSTSIGSNAVGGREGTITIGANANNGSLYATVIGTDSKVNYMTRNSGAAATIVGAKSEIKNDNKSYSGVANGIFGSANTIENSNGVTIQGSGNTVTNAYKDMSGLDFNLGGVYVKKDAGAVGVIGGMNTVSNQIYTNVIGFGNTVAGDADNISHDVFVAGSRNNLSKVSDSIVMGNNNTISDRSNVISFGHQNTISASNAVAIGNGASVSVEGGVALGVGSVADRANAVSVGSTGANRQIINVAAGTEGTDAVNVSQLQKVSDTANAGWNLYTNGVATEATNVKPGEYVGFSGDKNISVSHDGTKVQVKLNENIDVNSIQTNALNAKYNLSVGTANENGTVPFLVNSTGAFYAANNNFSVDKYGKVIATAGEIGNVVLKNGVYTGNSALRDGELYVGDASGNYSQITPKSAKLGQVTIDEKGNMAGVNSIQTNALNAKYNLSVGTMAENGIMPFLVNSTGAFYAANNNFSVDKDGKVIATAGEIGNVVLQNGVYTGNSALRDGELYVGDASGNYSQITTTGAKLGQVTIAADGKISGVAAGEADTDAVNVSQLNAVKETANKGWNLSTNGGEASKVAPDATVDFSGDKNISVSHDGTKVQVELNKNIDVNYVQTNALNAKYNLSVGTANENGTVPFLVSSTGAFYAANNNFSVDKDGKVIATAGEIGNVVLQNGVYTGKSALRDGELYLGDASGNYSQITPKSAKLGQVTIDEKGNMAGVNSIQTNALNAKYNLSVGTMAENGIMPFLVSSTGAFYAANNNFSVDKDGKVIATAGEIGNVVLQNGVYTGKSALRDGELYVGDASGNYSQITTTGAKLGQVTIAADGKISGVAAGEADTDAVNVSQLNAVKETANKGWNLSTNGGEASKVAPDATVDFSGDKNISVSHDGTKVQVELNKNIDVNYVQTNALNAKYNLSVGTANENGTVPFLVSSTGAFYAANNNFSVDKYGKVIATAGEIGNVVLQNGVYTGNSALRDGELYLGDASGNYSQITPKSAKLGQVTIDEKGNMAGVNSIQTNALNAKYNLSVGTMAENGIMPFLVNSTGAFYAANNNFSVDKYGKVIATAGEIGNVVLQNGVYTGNSALRDGELYVGDASGNYSQITTTGAKLGQVTIAADGKISGVAAGEVSKTSTDAINGSQLHQTNENVAALDKRVTQNEADIAQNKADIAQNKADIAQNKADIAQNKADIA